MTDLTLTLIVVCVPAVVFAVIAKNLFKKHNKEWSE